MSGTQFRYLSQGGRVTIFIICKHIIVFLFFHFIESPSRQNEVFTSANDSLATIDIPIPPQHKYDIDILVSENEQNITESILDEYRRLNLKSAKMYVSIDVLMVRNQPSKGDADESPETSYFYILSTSALNTRLEIPDFLEHIKATVSNRIENTQNQLQGSGWVIREIAKFQINICKFAKGAIGNYIAYPASVRDGHNIINPNVGENCLLIALASFFYLKIHPDTEPGKLATKIRRNPRKFWQDRLNIGSLNSVSIGWESLSELEKLNHVRFNIYNLDKQNHNKSKYCLQLVHHSRSNYERVNLLLLNEDHVCLIKDLKQYYKNFIHRNKPITHICCRCLTIFDDEADCSNHTLNCNAQTTIAYAQPCESVGFQKFKSLYPHSYVCFTDFESLNKKLPDDNENSQQLATQHAFVYKYSIVSIIDKNNQTIAKEKTYFGEDYVNDMLTSLTNDWKSISSK